MKEYWEEDSHAVEALLFFDQLVGKVQLLEKVIESKFSVVDSMESTVPYQLIAICEVS